jgi:hypothetical protein
MGLEKPLSTIGGLVHAIRDKAGRTGRPLRADELQALVTKQECLDAGGC